MWGGSTGGNGLPRLTNARRVMIIRTIIQFVVDDRGQDLVEYALLSGVIGVAGVLLFPVIAGKMGAAYASWTSGAQTAWEPCAPAGGACP
jgi:Flp pilus assembly pilin Flp